MIRRNRFLAMRVCAICIGCMLALMTSLPLNTGNRLYSGLPVDVPVIKQRDLPHRNKNMKEATVIKNVANGKSDIASNKAVEEQIVDADEEKDASDVDDDENVEELDSLTKNDTEIVNRHPYRYLITPTGTCKKDPLVVVFIHSALPRFSRREAIRQTWGNATYHMKGKLKLFFVIASSTDETKMQSINIESRVYNDILQENFIDDYKNLTIKVVGALRWIVSHCKRTPFVLKTDDDAFVNVFSLLSHLTDLAASKQTSDLLMCRYMGRMPVLRKGKWAVSKQEYPDAYYPPYCSGLAVIMSMDVAQSLYETAFRTPNFWVDDAWLTGIVAKNAGLNHTNIAKAFTMDKSVTETKFYSADWYQYLFAHLGVKGFHEIWRQLVVTSSKDKIPKSDTIIPGVVVNSRKPNRVKPK